MEARRRLLVRNKSRLPPEYQEVKYIKTPGPWDRFYPPQVKSFICTNLSYQNVRKIVCRYKVISYTELSYSYYPMVIASHESGKTSPRNPFATISSVNGFNSISPVATPPYVGVENEYTILTNASTFFLRIGGWQDAEWTAEGAYYYVYVYGENDAEVAKFIPCYRKADNKPGMYELIGNVFYPSDGTEDFIAGPNV